jgi:hypothetical protein
MKILDKFNNPVDRRLVEVTFSPSWLSLIVAVLVAVGIVAWVILSFELKKTGYEQILVHPRGGGSQSVLTLPGQSYSGSNTNSLQNTWPLIAFWGIIGLFVYILLENVYNVIHSFKEVNDEMYFMHAKRDLLVKSTIELIVFRLVSVIAWLFFMDYFFKRIIPMAINYSRNSVHAINLSSSILDVVVALVVLLVAMHINTIFLRLALKRPRIFSSSNYLDV